MSCEAPAKLPIVALQGSHVAFVVLLAWHAIGVVGCEKDAPQVDPPQPTACEYAPGNRNYTWRIDTIGWFPSVLGGVWAFSDSNAFVMGQLVDCSTPRRVFPGRRWDGKTWDYNIYTTYFQLGIDVADVTGDENVMVVVGSWGMEPTMYAGAGEFDNRTKKWRSYHFDLTGKLRAVWTDGNGYFVAMGDSGLTCTKDGYNSDWVCQRIPTNFTFYKVNGVSKHEVYALGHLNMASGASYTQIQKFDGNTWVKMFDGMTPSTGILNLTPQDTPTDVWPLRCSITDSLTLYVVGDYSYIFRSLGQETSFERTNLSDLGLPLKQNGRTALDINAFNPCDIWILGTRFNFYHWNGSDFQKIVIPGLPNDDLTFGDQQRMVKTSSGKIFMPSELGASQIYGMVQGIPN